MYEAIKAWNLKKMVHNFPIKQRHIHEYFAIIGLYNSLFNHLSSTNYNHYSN